MNSTVTLRITPFSLSAVLQFGTLYQQPITTCLHHHLVSVAVSSRLN